MQNVSKDKTWSNSSAGTSLTHAAAMALLLQRYLYVVWFFKCSKTKNQIWDYVFSDQLNYFCIQLLTLKCKKQHTNTRNTLPGQTNGPFSPVFWLKEKMVDKATQESIGGGPLCVTVSPHSPQAPTAAVWGMQNKMGPKKYWEDISYIWNVTESCSLLHGEVAKLKIEAAILTTAVRCISPMCWLLSVFLFYLKGWIRLKKKTNIIKCYLFQNTRCALLTAEQN